MTAGRDTSGMSELSNSPLRHGISAAQGTTEAGALRCQWCSVPLQPGVTICPTCGSAGIPDPRMSAGRLDELDITDASPSFAPIANDAAVADERELVEWWKLETLNADPLDEPLPAVASFEDVERRRTQSLVFICGAVVVCGMLGWLIGPSLLVGPFEGLTGTTVTNLSDLRGMGTIGGILLGLFIGSTGSWVIWSSR
jgi:hypothetical protein